MTAGSETVQVVNDDASLFLETGRQCPACMLLDLSMTGFTAS